MKLYLALVFLFFSVSAKSESSKPLFVCSLYYSKEVKAKAVAQGKFDKYLHCSISCMLARRCPADDVLEIGLLKELVDLFGPGNADVDDLKADAKGVEMATLGSAKSDQQCIDGCHKIYPGKCH